jgi:hypothetical protein
MGRGQHRLRNVLRMSCDSVSSHGSGFEGPSVGQILSNAKLVFAENMDTSYSLSHVGTNQKLGKKMPNIKVTQIKREN